MEVVSFQVILDCVKLTKPTRPHRPCCTICEAADLVLTSLLTSQIKILILKNIEEVLHGELSNNQLGLVDYVFWFLKTGFLCV